jgi:hypothetical protein
MGNLLSAVDETLTVLASGLDAETLEMSLLEITEAVDRLQAGRLQCLAQLDAYKVGDADHGGSTAAWLRELTMCASAAAGRDVYLARDLAALPLLATALVEGRIGLDQARMIAGLRKDVPDSDMAAALPDLIEAAKRNTPDSLRPKINDVRHALAPAQLADREKLLYEQRSLSMTSTADDAGVGSWRLPQGMQEIVLTAIHAFSSPATGDDRSPAQRRADALVTICEQVLNGGTAPETGGVRPHVSVLVSLETLEQRAGAPAASYGFESAASDEWARRMCCDAGISRIIADAKGEILDSGRTTRTFTAAQRRAVIARDRHCVWPGCVAPAAWCEVHHRVHWIDHPETSVDNGVLMCGRHHDRVHVHRHRIVIGPDGSRSVDLRRGSYDDPDPPPERPDPPPDRSDPPPTRLDSPPDRHGPPRERLDAPSDRPDPPRERSDPLPNRR